MLLVVWWFGERCLHLRVISCAFRVISRQLLPGSQWPSAGSVPGITLCPRITLHKTAGLIFFHILLVVWCFAVRCLHLRVISCAFRVIFRQLLPGSRGPSAGSVPGITLCPRITQHKTAGLIFFHILLVVWCFAVRCLHILGGLCEVSAEVRG
jgi:hypothetical protein